MVDHGRSVPKFRVTALENEVGIRHCRPKCRSAECLGRQIFAELKDHLKQFSRRSNFQLLKPQIKFKSSFVARCYHHHIFLRFLPCLQPQGIQLKLLRLVSEELLQNTRILFEQS